MVNHSFDREKQIQQLDSDTTYDIVVIGGGASGLGIAVDAATRGFKVALFESYDFAKGTSSRSTKLVHGGVRYLAQGNIKLVFGALKERGLLKKNASHLFKNQSFLIPSYSIWHKLYYGFGLKVYDWLALKKSLGASKMVSKDYAKDNIPTIKTKSLVGGVTYQDGQFDDARLALNLAQTAVENNAVVLNYMKVVDFLKDENNHIIGVQVLDKETNAIHDVKSKVVVNATGVFANKILKKAGRKKNGLKIVPSQGIHLVLDKSFLPNQTALMVPKTSDGRVLFAIPWHNKVVVGTTDTPIKKPSYEPEPILEEVDFILQNAGAYLEKQPTMADVKAVFAGLRPLVASKGDKSNTKEISRGHKIIHSESGLTSIVGGKWTTYREMAEDLVNEVIKVHHLPNKKSKTEALSIHGNTSKASILNSELWYYGSDEPSIRQMYVDDPKTKEKLSPHYNFTAGQVIWAVQNEMARTIEDVVARRFRLLFLDAEEAITIAPKVADILKQHLNKDEAWAQHQIEEFTTLAKGYLLKPNK
jgi:glycerol-3-phosphate dehydrogenase